MADSRSPKAAVGLFGFFALGFGCIVGSGWVVLLGQWLGKAGPLGAVSALGAGALIMVPVGLVYGELASRMPQAGADYLYARTAFGRRTGFVVGWFMVLFLLLITAFEGIVLAWLLETLLPALQGPALYAVLREPVRVDAAVIGLGGVVALTALNLRGMGASVAAQSWITSAFLVIACVTLATAAAWGALRPVAATLSTVRPSAAGWLWVFATSALFYNGFQAVPQVVEDRSSGVSSRGVAWVIAGSIAAAFAFYVLAISCTSVAAPWRWTVSQPLPAAAAVAHAWPALGAALLVAAAVSVTKTWNGTFVTVVQMLVALSRDGVLPSPIARTDRRGVHRAAILFTAAANAVGVMLGRGAITPLLDMGMLAVGVAITTCCAAAWRLRVTSGPAPYTPPGGLALLLFAILGVGLLAAAAIAGSLLRGGVPVEFVLMAAWAALGAVFYAVAVRRRPAAALA